jgi:hypothetical protein
MVSVSVETRSTLNSKNIFQIELWSKSDLFISLLMGHHDISQLSMFGVHSFILLVVCLTTGPKPLPNRALLIVRSITSSFKWEYPLLSLRSSSSFLRLLPRLRDTSITPRFWSYLAQCFLEWEMFQTKVVEKNRNIYFTFNNFLFLENRAVYEMMWKNRTGQTTDDNMAHAHCMLDTQG